MDGVDDLAAVDALEVDRRDAEAGMPKPALDDEQRHALARQFYGVRTASLVRREAAAHAGLRSDGRS